MYFYPFNKPIYRTVYVAPFSFLFKTARFGFNN